MKLRERVGGKRGGEEKVRVVLAYWFDGTVEEGGWLWWWWWHVG